MQQVSKGRWCAGLLLAALPFYLTAQRADETVAQRAVEAERRGDFRQAIALFRQSIGGGADSPELRTNLGIAYYQAGDMQSAYREFRVALEKRPDLQAANLFCGLSLGRLQRPREALLYLDRAHRAQPNDVTVLNALALEEVASK